MIPPFFDSNSSMTLTLSAEAEVLSKVYLQGTRGASACGVKQIGAERPDAPEPFLGEPLKDLDADDALAHAENLTVVGENRPLDGV